MKRVLLAFIAVFYLSTAFSQLAINELYLEPGCGTLGVDRSDYIELYNGTGNTIDLDCYRLAVLYRTSNVAGAETFLYVFDLPKRDIKSNGLFVFSGLSTFCYQGGSYTMDEDIDGLGTDNGYNWNSIDGSTSDAFLKKYKLKETDCNPSIEGVQRCWEEVDEYGLNNKLFDFLTQSSGNLYGGTYNVFLFSGSGDSENSLLFNYSSSVSPINIRNLPPLNDIWSSTCTSFDLNFSTIVNIESLPSASGSDNGYFRSKNGVCGTWLKANNAVDHTPGTNNISSSTVKTQGSGIFSLSSSLINCATGNTTVSATINVTFDNDSPYPITYYVFKDNEPYSQPLNPEIGTEDTPLEPISGTVYSNSDGLGQFTIQNLQPGTGYFIRAVNFAGCYSTTLYLPERECTILPVSFGSFVAARNKQNVSLNWQTATEQNNRGFNVQRNTKGVWENIAWVFSAADGGNSSNLLTYTYKDINNERGVSQYRIQQVDFDGKASYSVIRSVMGEEQRARTTVYPNPSMDGKVNVVFEDQSAKAVTVSDLSGRVVRQYRNVLNNVQIEGLESGMYSIQVTDLSSAVSTTEKVIIKKR